MRWVLKDSESNQAVAMPHLGKISKTRQNNLKKKKEKTNDSEIVALILNTLTLKTVGKLQLPVRNWVRRNAFE